MSASQSSNDGAPGTYSLFETMSFSGDETAHLENQPVVTDLQVLSETVHPVDTVDQLPETTDSVVAREELADENAETVAESADRPGIEPAERDVIQSDQSSVASESAAVEVSADDEPEQWVDPVLRPPTTHQLMNAATADPVAAQPGASQSQAVEALPVAAVCPSDTNGRANDVVVKAETASHSADSNDQIALPVEGNLTQAEVTSADIAPTGSAHAESVENVTDQSLTTVEPALVTTEAVESASIAETVPVVGHGESEVPAMSDPYVVPAVSAEAAAVEPAAAEPVAAPLIVDSEVAVDELAPTQPQSPTPAGIENTAPALAEKTTPTFAEHVPSANEDVTVGGQRFADLPLSDDVKSAVTASGYDTPTEIQAQIIPHMLAGRDVLAQSQTGSGKTAAFALPVLSQIQSTLREIQVLVLAPTRELAMQVADSFEKYGAEVPGFQVAAIYGGAGYDQQIRQLKRASVVVGTPGRVIDHIRKGTLKLSTLKCLVLDEADEMLNMGFLEDVQFVLEHIPEQRQVALFSATMPPPIRAIADRYLNEPARVTVRQKTMTAEAIRQRAVFVPPRDKMEVLARFLEVEETDGVIVFARTREATAQVADELNTRGLKAAALNGDMPQQVRERTVEQLKSGRLNIVVATDVAARGLDVPRIRHVFNYDVPMDNESYIHRIGRTGRAGKAGEAILFVTGGQKNRLRSIERATRQPIEIVEPPSADQVNKVRTQTFLQTISDSAASRDLSFFQQMLSDHSEATGLSMVDIAAALADQLQQGRPFFVEDVPKTRRRERDQRSGRDRFERDDHRDRGPRGGRDRRGPGGGSEPGMQRYRIEVGRADNVKPGNIVGAVANEGGIDGDDIGNIRIYDDYSTVDLPEGMPSDVFQTLRKVRIAGKQIRLARATPQDDQQDRSSGGKRDGRRFGGSRGQGGLGKKRFGGPNGGHGGGKRKSFGKKKFRD